MYIEQVTLLNHSFSLPSPSLLQLASAILLIDLHEFKRGMCVNLVFEVHVKCLSIAIRCDCCFGCVLSVKV